MKDIYTVYTMDGMVPVDLSVEPATASGVCVPYQQKELCIGRKVRGGVGVEEDDKHDRPVYNRIGYTAGVYLLYLSLKLA